MDAKFLSSYVKFVQTPGLLLMLNEMNGVYRQVFADARPPSERSNAFVARVLIGDVVRRHAGHRHDRIPLIGETKTLLFQ